MTEQMQSEKSQWWRAVLGEYPTGVSLLTAKPADGELLAMVVGTFMAVSQDPPLVGVLVDRASTTFPKIAAVGSFAVSVLGASHEQLSRDIAAKSPERFARAAFADRSAPHPHLEDAVAWFDTVIERRESFGDHDLVVGRVTDFGVGAAGSELPLLFRRAGYGTFAAPSEPYDLRSFVDRMNLTTRAAGDLAEAAEELGVPITVNTQIGDAVVTVGVATPARTSVDRSRIGRSFPFAAPVAPVFAAWAPEQRLHAWMEASRHLLGRVERAQIAKQLEGVRRRGCGLVARSATGPRFDTLFSDDISRPAVVETWEDILMLGGQLDDSPDDVWRRVSGVQVPVFRPDGEVLLALYASELPELPDRAALDAIVARLTAVSERIAERLAADAADVR
jgi:flavin reductase (DIM6/NTAB) family NADH-FMN oxidoreductase RutF/DNA-binding IclR family transcriptional regulator